jgi:hypothetical protein
MIKRRVAKKLRSRALSRTPWLAMKRERGDHRRWWWTAISPWTVTDSRLGEAKVHFHHLYGRLYSFDLKKLEEVS